MLIVDQSKHMTSHDLTTKWGFLFFGAYLFMGLGNMMKFLCYSGCPTFSSQVNVEVWNVTFFDICAVEPRVFAGVSHEKVLSQ